MSARIMRVLGMAVAVMLLLAPSRALAGSPAWDQERVTDIAAGFAEAVREVIAELEKQAEESDVIAERQRLAVIADVKRLSRQATDLAAELKGGAGRDETRPRYMVIQEIRSSAREQGRRVFNPDAPGETIVGARTLLDQLSEYYDDK